jgi:hypothetical protein
MSVTVKMTFAVAVAEDIGDQEAEPYQQRDVGQKSESRHARQAHNQCRYCQHQESKSPVEHDGTSPD